MHTSLNTSVKGFVAGGDDDKVLRGVLGGREVGSVLGIPWHLKSDKLSVHVRINDSGKERLALKTISQLQRFIS